jgi:hypothetical protein
MDMGTTMAGMATIQGRRDTVGMKVMASGTMMPVEDSARVMMQAEATEASTAAVTAATIEQDSTPPGARRNQ